MSKLPTPFNSPLETGVRSLSILEAAFPLSFDLQRLVEFDYLVVHSGDVGGPASLHVALPLRAGELLVRRELINKGLLLMMSRGLIERVTTAAGIEYKAAEIAAPYIASLTAPYSVELKSRSAWAVRTFGETSTEAIRETTQRFFEQWSSQFQSLYPPRAS
jgi:hypothetical protein